MRFIQLLNGTWDYRIGNGAFIKKTVPYSDLPAGESECVLHFNADDKKSSKRSFLIFDGITYSADVNLNGKYLGKMYPYSEYRFEISDILKEKDNKLSVKIYDCNVVFGPSEGWENYSGIIRNVYIEYTGACIIDETVWHTEFFDNYSKADCFIEYTLNGNSEETSFEAVLKDKFGCTVASGSSTNGLIKFSVDNPMLWSPDSPALYSLECSLYKDGNAVDYIQQYVGFKELITKGKRFYLNGSPLFLLGVNRHDMYGDHGHTLSEEEMVKDMRMIKDTGANYVRLVHYPHNKRIIALADELGLLVSEEPGLWWSDMHNKEICDGALEVLKRVILRDRNHVSIAFWLSFNECIFTLDFLKDSASVAKKYDKYHMVSGANCMTNEMTKENYPVCGFDFYTMHPYAPTPDRMLKSAEMLTEMPLLLTEWGGFYCYNNPGLFNRFADEMIKCWNNPEDKPVIAGAVYWCWAEMYEFSRGKPACKRGILSEGLVDKDRNPTPDLEVYKSAFSKLKYPKATSDFDLEYDYKVFSDKKYVAIDISGICCDNTAYWDKMICDSKVPVKPFYNPVKAVRKMEHGPIIPCDVNNFGLLPVKLCYKPYVITDCLEIPIERKASAIYITGNTSMPKGFPISGDYDEPVCEYIIEYCDGSSDTYVMKNGSDITTATAQHGPSRINPVAKNSPRVLRFNYDYDFEHYVVNIRTVLTDSTKTVKSLKIKNSGNNYNVLLYGITLKV